jgi:hypothetical protein
LTREIRFRGLRYALPPTLGRNKGAQLVRTPNGVTREQSTMVIFVGPDGA